MIKRLKQLTVIITIILCIYMIRLAYYQLVPSSWTTIGHSKQVPQQLAQWKKVATIQRQQAIVLDSGRGNFYDRFGQSITGEQYYTVAFFPAIISRWLDSSKEQSIEQVQLQLAQLANILQTNQKELTKYILSLQSPSFWMRETDSYRKVPAALTNEQIAEITALQLDGVRILPYENRYITAFKHKHMIGFVSEHPEWIITNDASALIKGKRKLTDSIGGSGLEQTLEPLIHSIGATTASYFMDGKKMPLAGLDVRIRQPQNRYYPLQVMTTLDLTLQNKLERYADQVSLGEGAIVVLDIKNADIIAMVSKPDLPPVFQTSDGSEWINHALTAIAPGSIYKLVTAAAALEAGVVHDEERFICNGSYGKYKLTCWKKDGHGALTWREGMAHSCNIVFANLAERVGSARLQLTAEALGMTGKVGWIKQQSSTKKKTGKLPQALRLLQEEEYGRIYLTDDEQVDGGMLVQSSIGQRDVAITPLQAANLVVTLLHQGQVLQPRSVREIRYADGQLMERIQEQSTHRARIKPSTAYALLESMQSVMQIGTGKSIAGGKWKLAGKSGTAELEKNGQKTKVHQWFIGYGPIEQPRYAVAVVSKNRSAASNNQAMQIFRQVFELAAEME
ncbi:peptidoglycan D,D-transpeptidase FtsI family protein [Paenibacillus yanchengensis]|uniref:Peptidoglycan D,D-transpeptidase FtsI family protein n=1 Tax=Paenibacillus yanchengensis TaxID=2035833 RepID=A0ABW4YLU0_9BACL